MFEISIKSFYDISRLFGTNVPNLGMFLRLLVTFYISKLLMLFTYSISESLYTKDPPTQLLCYKLPGESCHIPAGFFC